MTFLSSLIMLIVSIIMFMGTVSAVVFGLNIVLTTIAYGIDIYLLLSTGDRFIHGFIFKEPLGPPILSFLINCVLKNKENLHN